MPLFPEPVEPAGTSTQTPACPHLQWPIRTTGPNAEGLAFVEQDSPLEIAQCVGLVVTARPGDFPDEPEFGTEQPELRMNGVPESVILAAVDRWEPRADLEFATNELTQLVQSITATVEPEEVAQ